MIPPCDHRFADMTEKLIKKTAWGHKLEPRTWLTANSWNKHGGSLSDGWLLSPCQPGWGLMWSSQGNVNLVSTEKHERHRGSPTTRSRSNGTVGTPEDATCNSEQTLLKEMLQDSFWGQTAWLIHGYPPKKLSNKDNKTKHLTETRPTLPATHAWDGSIWMRAALENMELWKRSDPQATFSQRVRERCNLDEPWTMNEFDGTERWTLHDSGLWSHCNLIWSLKRW